MLVERETFVSLFLAAVAILVIIGGYASFTGLAVKSGILDINVEDSYGSAQEFDASIVFKPATFPAEESAVIYIDGELVSVISLKKYLDDNSIDYGLEYRNVGSNNVRVINLGHDLNIDISSFVSSEHLGPGEHDLKIDLSESDASVDSSFEIG